MSPMDIMLKLQFRSVSCQLCNSKKQVKIVIKSSGVGVRHIDCTKLNWISKCVISNQINGFDFTSQLTHEHSLIIKK